MQDHLKILHISAVNHLTSGQRQQLHSERKSADQITNAIWDIVAFHNGPIIHSFERNYPKIFCSLFLRNLYCWVYMIRISAQYDFVLQRHMPFDPFCLIFSWFIKNRATVHHSKSIEELKIIRKGWKGMAASALERITCKVNSHNVKAIIGVTPEIAKYVCIATRTHKPFYFYPNGIQVETISVLEDYRNCDLNIAFVCGTFSDWHGLNDLIEMAIVAKKPLLKINIHLIGKLFPEQISLLRNTRIENINFVRHGYLHQNDYISLLSRCDVGISSLALHKKKLIEATTLKVREYLAMGLPVIASHKDSALPDDFPYYANVRVEKIFDVAAIIKKKNYSRLQVRDASINYIDKKLWMEALLWELSALSSAKQVKNQSLETSKGFRDYH